MFTSLPILRRGKGDEAASKYGQRRNLGSFNRYRPVLILLTLVLVLFAGAHTASSQVIPTISILSVVTDQSVTIRTHNYPPGQVFTVMMGPMGARGFGPVVGTLHSGAGGSLTATYNIPAELRGARQISIRLQTAHARPYFSFNWFFNNTTAQPPVAVPAPFTGIPTIHIVSVVRDSSVTFQTNNYPPNQVFTVTMGPIGTRGIGGHVAGSFNSGAGGSFQQTFPIPAQLHGSHQISIRAQTAHSQPFFSFNWFYNTTTGAPPLSPPVPAPVPVPPPFVGIPTFTICHVVRDSTVTIRTNNFPPGQLFTVTMGLRGTQGIGGAVVGTLDSGAGGTMDATFNIPAHLHGHRQISILAQTAHARPFFAYNWFHNNTASVCP